LADYNNGPWDQVGKVYEKMMQEVEEKKYQPTFVSREVYLKCDFINQENCITEVQFGIN
jgi:effector-binding domain-containing protein